MLLSDQPFLNLSSVSESVHLANEALFVLLKGRGKTFSWFYFYLFVCTAQEIKADLFKVNDCVLVRGKHLSVSYRFLHLFLSSGGTFLPSKTETTVNILQ